MHLPPTDNPIRIVPGLPWSIYVESESELGNFHARIVGESKTHWEFKRYRKDVAEFSKKTEKIRKDDRRVLRVYDTMSDWL